MRSRGSKNPSLFRMNSPQFAEDARALLPIDLRLQEISRVIVNGS